MRKVDDGGKEKRKRKKKKENNDENSGPLTSLPVDRLTATDCNADRSCQFCMGFLGTIRSSLATSYGTWRRRATSLTFDQSEAEK